MDLYDAISIRRTVRTFEKDGLDDDDRALIKRERLRLDKRDSVFSSPLSFFHAGAQDMKALPTYGLIKHPTAFIGASFEKSLAARVDYGFVMEHAVLSLCAAGLGTAWIGLFRLDTTRIGLAKDAHVPAVVAIGRPKLPSWREKTLKKVSRGASRKSPQTLFYKAHAPQGIGEETYRASSMYAALEALRRAPSSMNRQPWRVVFDDHRADVYIERPKGVFKPVLTPLQAVDAGIGLCHFTLGLKTMFNDVRFSKETPLDARAFEYVVSVRWS